MAKSCCNKACIVQGEKYRFSVLTPFMMRMEYSETGVFEDLQTQTVLNREFPVPEYSVTQSDDRLEIETEAFHMIYDKKKFSEEGLFIDVKYDFTNYGGRWYFGAKTYSFPPREHNLKGTMRTLDRADGEVELEYGLMDKSGRTFFDDSKSFVFDEENMPSKRKHEEIDVYYLAYGRDYFACLRDFYKLSGAVPLLPRYALGNWWSRYWKYSEESYIELLTEFEKRNIPFSVAVMDMDWHIVDVPMESGGGWTGYTWNNDLFPNPERFLSWLHEHNYHVTLNVHPASGIRNFEKMYKDMAEYLGINPDSKKTIEFDMTNKEFVEAYFKFVHHPHENAGVDFWWIDWQQGNNGGASGIDPLWMLNYFHFKDMEKRGRRGLILSRYGGLGSHRYPIGFSGDTIVTWKSLEFQPYFTATASNVGYTWWSHDIGGHMLGIRSDVMEARWYELGTFSPINRLHSTKMSFSGKEPWNFRPEVEHAMGEALRLRHQLLPYIYTMNYLAYKEYRPVIAPMYYDYPEKEQAYPVQDHSFVEGVSNNQYLFGTDMIVAPITSDQIASLNQGKVKAWIPEGCYHDFFTGLIYKGEKVMWMFRGINSIPVLVKAGGIIPMQKELFGKDFLKNPEELIIRVYGGADGNYTHYEDDGETEDYKDGRSCCFTSMHFDWERGAFTIEGAAGQTDLIPEFRDYTVELCGVKEAVPKVYISGKEIKITYEYQWKKGCIRIHIPKVSVDEKVEIVFEQKLTLNDNHTLERVYDLLNQAQDSNLAKESAYRLLSSGKNLADILGELETTNLKKEIRLAVIEIMTADL